MQRPRVLIVEDHKDTAELLVAALAHRGLDCDRAGDVRQAVAKFNAACDAGLPCYDAVVMDVDLPSASGLQLLKAIREVHEHLPVFILTAYDSELVQVRAREGNASVDEKPLVDPDTFLEKVTAGAEAHHQNKAASPHPRVIVPEVVEAMIAHAASAAGRGRGSTT